jgi:hypothetical protein
MAITAWSAKVVKEELRALGEVSQAINSTLDVETVLTAIVSKAGPIFNLDYALCLT